MIRTVRPEPGETAGANSRDPRRTTSLTRHCTSFVEEEPPLFGYNEATASEVAELCSAHISTGRAETHPNECTEEELKVQDTKLFSS